MMRALLLLLLLAQPAFGQIKEEPLTGDEANQVPEFLGKAVEWVALPLHPTDAPPTCKNSRYGWIYVDLSLKALCICAPSGGTPKWCNIRTAACGTDSDCG